MATEEQNNAGPGCFLAVITLGLVVPCYIWRGYVLSVLWTWFVVPTFDLPRLGIATAIGVALTVGMLTGGNGDDSEEGKPPSVVFAKAMGAMFLTPLIVFGVGWIVQGCM